MNVIAQSQATEHTLLQTSKAKSVFIMLDPFLQHRSNDHRVVALRNDRSNAMDVVRYYLVPFPFSFEWLIHHKPGEVCSGLCLH
jgi:hypothetical protein